MTFSRLFVSLTLMLVASAATLAQNFNSSNAASVRGSNTIIMIGVGAVTLVAGAVIGYAIGRRKSS